jgi:branched-chain amino acid transport system substrate-binding protein
MKLDKPIGSYATGFGVRFDQNYQNTRALPVVAQWQNGKIVTVYPIEATPEGAKLSGMRRK